MNARENGPTRFPNFLNRGAMTKPYKSGWMRIKKVLETRTLSTE